MAIHRRFQGYVTAIVLLFTIVSAAQTKYSGGSGEPNDPYQIATAENLMLLGETPEDYDKHFILTTDIDLDPNLPGRKVFDRAVIAPDTDDVKRWFQGTAFTGVFNGKGFTISHLQIKGREYLGLFGMLGYKAVVYDLGIVFVNINGTGECVGGLVGWNSYGSVKNSYNTGRINGTGYSVGGLVGENSGTVTQCYNTCAVSGTSYVGGIVGYNSRDIAQCYSIGSVKGNDAVGGLVGTNVGSIVTSYSTGTVVGAERVGGLMGSGDPTSIKHSIWDVETSGLPGSVGGVGLTTAEMMDPYMLGLNGFANDPNWILDPGQDYPRLDWEGTHGSVIPEPIIDWLEGGGTPEDPYQIHNAEQLIFLSKASIMWDKHFILCADIDLNPNLPGRSVFGQAVIPIFTGVLDGNGHIISNLTITGDSYLGLFGLLDSTASVFNLGLEAVDIVGTGHDVGGLVGRTNGTVIQCYSTGSVNGNDSVGGLVGSNFLDGGSIITSYSTCSVIGNSEVGGLVGSNNWGTMNQCYSTGSFTVGLYDVGGLVGSNSGGVTNCHSMGAVSGGSSVGGLAGSNCGEVANCYSTSTVSGDSSAGGLIGSNQVFYFMGRKPAWSLAPVGGLVTGCYITGAVSGKGDVGGLVGESCGQIYNCYSTSAVTAFNSVGGLVGSNYVGWNDGGNGAEAGGIVAQCYSTGSVSGNSDVGGLVGHEGWYGSISSSFWDIETSGQTISAGGTGKTTAEMHDIRTYQDARWDFWAESQDGLHEIWHMPVEGGYPLLAIFNGYTPPELQGMGTIEEPYLINDALELGAIVHYSLYAHYRLTGSIDLSDIRWSTSLIPMFAGTFDGNGHTISHLTINGWDYLGLCGQLKTGAEVRNLGVMDVNITGLGDFIGGLVGLNGYYYQDSGGTIIECYSTGVVTGNDNIGGLVGLNEHRRSQVTQCFSTCSVSGNNCVGGLVGSNLDGGSIITSYSIGLVRGGGNCIGGLVGSHDPYYGSIVTDCFWDTQTSGQANSDGGTGKTTAEMQTASTFLEAGWDFVDETENGTEDIWWIDEGKDYPRLWWEEIEQ